MKSRLSSYYRSFCSLIAINTILLSLSSCLDDDSLEFSDTNFGNFEACWTAMDEHYCFFEEKEVDWDKVYKAYKPYFKDSIKNVFDEFNLMAQMLAEVRDGHVNLYSPFNTARYWKWNLDYPDNFDANLLSKYYLGENYWIASSLQYCMLSDTVAYVRYGSFSSSIGGSNLDYVLAMLRNAKGLILDIRNNGGGSLTNVPLIANRFATQKTVYSYMQHKTGTGHNDFSEPQPLYLEPEEGRLQWDASLQPVVVLTNRSCFSAANNFVAAMKSLDGTMTADSLGIDYPKLIKTCGDRTGGGGGMPFETVLPNGWTLRMSACPISNHLKQSVEEGIEPDLRCDMDSLHMFNDHIDDIIECARAYINNNTRKVYPKRLK